MEGMPSGRNAKWKECLVEGILTEGNPKFLSKVGWVEFFKYEYSYKGILSSPVAQWQKSHVAGIPSGRNPKGQEFQVAGIPSGRNPKRQECQVAGIPSGRNPKWQKSLVAGIPSGRNP